MSITIPNNPLSFMEGESVALQFDAMDWENVHSKNLE